jgi:hypothetical protein
MSTTFGPACRTTTVTSPHDGPHRRPDRTAAQGGGRADLLESENAQLRRAMETRPLIDQARGMVMAMGPCPPDYRRPAYGRERVLAGGAEGSDF